MARFLLWVKIRFVAKLVTKLFAIFAMYVGCTVFSVTEAVTQAARAAAVLETVRPLGSTSTLQRVGFGPAPTGEDRQFGVAGFVR